VLIYIYVSEAGLLLKAIKKSAKAQKNIA